jgi:Tfp pilus assembly protein PilF
VKKIIFVIAISLALTEAILRLFGNFYFIRENKADSSKLKKIIACYGDSITYGDGGNIKGYPFFLEKKVSNLGYKVFNFAYPNANTFETYELLKKADFKNKKYIALFMIGGGNIVNYRGINFKCYDSYFEFLYKLKIYKLYLMLEKYLKDMFKNKPLKFRFQSSNRAFVSVDFFKFLYDNRNEIAVKYFINGNLKKVSELKDNRFILLKIFSFIEKKEYEKAISILNSKYFYDNYGESAYLSLKSYVLILKKNFGDARKNLEKALELKKNDVFLIDICAFYNYELNYYNEALKFVNYSLGLKKDFGFTYYLAGKIYESYDIKQALKYFEKGILNDKLFIPNYLEAAKLNVKYKRKEKAKYFCKKADDILKNYYKIKLTEIYVIFYDYIDENKLQFVKYEKYLKTLISYDPSNYVFKKALADLYFYEKNYDEAEKNYESLGESNICSLIKKKNKIDDNMIKLWVIRDLNAIYAFCLKNDITPVFLNYPTFDNIAMKEFVSNNDVYFIDLYKYFGKNTKKEYLLGKYHLTNEGNEKIAEIIFNRLKEFGILK